MDKARFQELLAVARANAAAAEERNAVLKAQALQAAVKDVDVVDTSLLGISDDTVKTDEGAADAVDVIREVIASSLDAQQQQKTPQSVDNQDSETSQVGSEDTGSRIPGTARIITLNEKQAEFNELVQTGKDCVLIGAAGTGKTTSMRKVTEDLIASGRVKNLHEGTKWLAAGLPGAVVVSYTRKAVNNIRHAVIEELKPHTLTLHKVLEFAPIYYEIEDEENPGNFKKTMRFEPQRNRMNPLPPDLTCAAFEESSMIGGIEPHAAHKGELYNLWREAMPHAHQEIFIGDIQQLPPIFGMAILGFKMLELPVVELTQVYRQALESPIISLAWKILEGNPHEFSSKSEKYEVFSPVFNKIVTRIRIPALEKFTVSKPEGSVKFQVWQKQLSSDNGLNTAVKQFNTWADGGYYNPKDDIILCPYNKAFGTVEINKGISQHLGTQREATVHEVIAGFNKHYLAIGDRVLHDKEDAFIVDIAHNSEYLGKKAQPASKNLDRWGHYRDNLTVEESLSAQTDSEEMDMAAIEKFMATAAIDTEERVQAASHVVTIRYAYHDTEENDVELEDASSVNALIGGYAITVHKAQGSEWEKVFFIMHNSHAVMNQRELLYTAVTRARKFLHIIAEPFTFEKGIKSQRIKGNTLAEKAEFFKGKKPELTEKQKQLELEKETGEFKAGIYKGAVKPAEIVMPEPVKPPQPLVKMSEFVSAAFKAEAQDRLTTHWNRAITIWGPSINPIPTLDYNLQFHDKLGIANAGKNLIKLNPVWCVAAEDYELDHPEIKHEMIETTLIHEICHIVGTRFGHSRGHDSGWIMSMKLMGVKPDVMYAGDTLPPWMDTYKEIVARKRMALQMQNADTFTTEYMEEGEEA